MVRLWKASPQPRTNTPNIAVGGLNAADANPAWPFDTLSEMMRTHLDQTLTEATARLTADWDADIAAYHDIHLHILASSPASRWRARQELCRRAAVLHLTSDVVAGD